MVIAQSSMTGFLVLFLHDVRGVGVASAAALLAAVQMSAAVARLAIGRWSDRLGRRIVPMRGVALANTLLFALVAALVHGPGAVVYPLLLCAAVSAMTWNGLAFTAAAEISGRARAGTAMSIQNMVVAVGSAIAPAAFGALVAATTWTTGYAACALAPLLAFFVLTPLVHDEQARLEASALRRRLATAGQAVDEAAQPLGRSLQRSDGVAEREHRSLELLHSRGELGHDRHDCREVLVGRLDSGRGAIDVRRDEREVVGEPLERRAHLAQVGARLVEAPDAHRRHLGARDGRRFGGLLERLGSLIETLERGSEPGHGPQPVHQRRNRRERRSHELPESHLSASLPKEHT
jgi:hypothetical protein